MVEERRLFHELPPRAAVTPGNRHALFEIPFGGPDGQGVDPGSFARFTDTHANCRLAAVEVKREKRSLYRFAEKCASAFEPDSGEKRQFASLPRIEPHIIGGGDFRPDRIVDLDGIQLFRLHPADGKEFRKTAVILRRGRKKRPPEKQERRIELPFHFSAFLLSSSSAWAGLNSCSTRM